MAKKVTVVSAVPLTTRDRDGNEVVLPIGTPLELDPAEAESKRARGFVVDPPPFVAVDGAAAEEAVRKAAEEDDAKKAAPAVTSTTTLV